MPFQPRRLLLTYDDAGGQCARVVARMKTMLEDRAFLVSAMPIAEAPTDLEGFHGVVLGTPVGVRQASASPAVLDWVARAEELDEKRVAIFATFWLRPGSALRQLREALVQRGVEVVAEHGYWLVRPEDGNHLLPAECMIRIR